jgi:hypothetical protein
MTISIGEVLTRAWQILWKYKVLWIFGILAGCSSSGTSGNNFQYTFSSGDFGNLPPGVENTINRLSQQPGLVAGIIAGFFALICLLVLLVVVLGTFGRIGLIAGTHKADAGAERLTFSELFQAAKPYFWRIFGLHVLLGLAAFLLIMLFMVFFIAFATVTLGFGALCLLPLLCLLIPLAWLVAVLIEQADIAIVLEDLSIPDGLSRAWQVINANWGTMIVMALILFLGMALVSVLIALPLILITFPAMFAFLAAGPAARYTLLSLGLLCTCIFVPILILVNGLLQTYYHSAWTLTFLRATGRGPSLPVPAQVPSPG